MKRLLIYTLRFILLFTSLAVVTDGMAPEVAAARRTTSKKSRKTGKSRSKKRNLSNRKGAGKYSSRRNSKRSRAQRVTAVQNLLNTPDSTIWVRKGLKDIIIYKDSLGVVRAMTPYAVNGSAARKYASAVNRYAERLDTMGVKVYTLLVPSQGEYYMPEIASTRGAEKRTIEIAASSLSPLATGVLINDTMAAHLDEEIYSRTDHHWAPLGAYYGAKAFAAVAGVPFRPLSDYEARTVHNYVGTMHKFSGDAEITKYPEEFVYYMPPTGYKSEFITYSMENGAVKESAPHEENFFREYPDGSGAAYSTFMGGDYRAVKVTDTGGPVGRKLLIVKDSYGNALAPCLFGSFEEVHVLDFRYFPHNLIDYVSENGITDMVFVNVLSIGMSPTFVERLNIMLEQK